MKLTKRTFIRTVSMTVVALLLLLFGASLGVVCTTGAADAPGPRNFLEAVSGGFVIASPIWMSVAVISLLTISGAVTKRRGVSLFVATSLGIFGAWSVYMVHANLVFWQVFWTSAATASFFTSAIVAVIVLVPLFVEWYAKLPE